MRYVKRTLRYERYDVSIANAETLETSTVSVVVKPGERKNVAIKKALDGTNFVPIKDEFIGYKYIEYKMPEELFVDNATSIQEIK